MKFILLLLGFYFFAIATSFAYGGDTATCKCSYYSSYKISVYNHKKDSISSLLYKKYGNVILIGQRSFATSNLLFITITRNNEYKGFFYDLVNKKNKIVHGNEVKVMADRILADTMAIKSSDKIPCQYISHDFGFFVSFKHLEGTYEVCYSQVLSVRDKSIGALFLYYLDKFK
jgi:hypothetical protein